MHSSSKFSCALLDGKYSGLERCWGNEMEKLWVSALSLVPAGWKLAWSLDVFLIASPQQLECHQSLPTSKVLIWSLRPFPITGKIKVSDYSAPQNKDRAPGTWKGGGSWGEKPLCVCRVVAV